MKTTESIKLFVMAMFVVSSGIIFTACGEDDNDNSYTRPSSGNATSNTQKITKPTFDKFITTADYDGFSVKARFKTGGDKESNLSATIYWQKYSSKPTKTPAKSELKKIESMRQYGSATYHNTGSKKGMTESIVFDKSHAGFSGGTYIYYYVECSNSVGSANSPIRYTIVKR